MSTCSVPKASGEPHSTGLGTNSMQEPHWVDVRLSDDTAVRVNKWLQSPQKETADGDSANHGSTRTGRVEPAQCCSPKPSASPIPIEDMQLSPVPNWLLDK